MKSINIPLAVALFLTFAFALASPTDQVVKIENGINLVDIVGDGTDGMILIGHRENFNAHSFDVATFFVKVDGKWNIVPIFVDKHEKSVGLNEKLSLTVSGGADCVLHDFRILKPSTRAAINLIVADRDLTNSYADADKVVFSYFKLVRREEVGSPIYAFELLKKESAKKQYCDVGNAFHEELGIGLGR